MIWNYQRVLHPSFRARSFLTPVIIGLLLGLNLSEIKAQGWATTQQERLELNRRERESKKAAEKASEAREKKLAELAAKPKPTPKPEVIPAGVTVIEVESPNALNLKVPFYVRPPADYKVGESGQVRRVLLLFPFFPESGIKALNRSKEYRQLADERGWFLVSPTFQMGKDEARDRTKSYYYPEGWSGKVILQAMDEMGKRYPIDPNRLFVAGLSGGAQVAHRFAMWAPNRVEAAAINSSGWFDAPTPEARKIAWMITIGESDPIFPETLGFVEKLQKIGVKPILRTYLGMIHEDSARVNTLCGQFFTERDEETRPLLGQPTELAVGLKYNEISSHPFIGDRRDGIYYANAADTLGIIPASERIFLPNQTIADLWGQAAE